MPYTKTQVDNMLDRNLNPFRQDVVDGTHTVGSPQAIVANTPVRFSVDGSVRNSAHGPTYFTDRWDTVNNKMTAVTEYDGPVYVADLAWTFDPSSASTGFDAKNDGVYFEIEFDDGGSLYDKSIVIYNTQ
jgi:hypothetical protein